VPVAAPAEYRFRAPTRSPGCVTGAQSRIPANWLGGADAARWLGNPAIDFVAGVGRNWSNISLAAYTQWRAGIVFNTGWRF
jgi:hypothetical protein